MRSAKLLQLSGMTGSVLFLFGVVAYFPPPRNMDLFVQFHLGLGLLLFLTFISTQGMTVIRSLRRRSTRYGLHTIIYSLIFVGILVLLNFLNARYFLRWDLTEAKIFTLSPQSIRVVRGLQQDLEIYGFFDGEENHQIADLIESYRYHSPKIKFEVVDPSRYPDMAKRLNVQQTDTLHLRYGNASASVQNPTEGAITNAIMKFMGRGGKKILLLNRPWRAKPHRNRT